MKITEHILLVDNDEITLELATRFLENAGYTVRATSRSSEALEMLSHPGLKLVVSEIELNHLTGFDLLAIMHKCQIDVPVVFLSHADDAGTQTEASQLGGAAFLSKKADFGELPEVARALLSGVTPPKSSTSIRIA